jgi:hypothetical protein
LSKGLEVKLNPTAPVEDMAVGRYITIEGAQLKFFGMITDVVLDNTNPQIEKTPPDVDDSFMREIYLGASVYGRFTSHITVLDKDAINPPSQGIPATSPKCAWLPRKMSTWSSVRKMTALPHRPAAGYGGSACQPGFAAYGRAERGRFW